MFRLIVVSKLDLALVSGKLTGLVKGDRVGTIQDVITGLEYKKKKKITLYISATKFEQNEQQPDNQAVCNTFLSRSDLSIHTESKNYARCSTMPIRPYLMFNIHLVGF